MNSMKITTRTKVNARSGPGLTYEAVSSHKAGETLTAISVESDVSGVSWYKIKDEHYICSKFCDVEIEKPPIGSTNKMRILSTQDNKIETNPTGAIVRNSGNVLDNTLDNVLNSSFVGQKSVAASWKRRIFATPYQFLGSTDIRQDPDYPNEGVGRMYMANILREAPILSIMPCKPNYLPSLSDTEKEHIRDSLLNLVSESATDLLKSASLGQIEDIETKYFSTDVDYVEYMKYVNLLCRGASLYMGIGDELVPGTQIAYKNYNWSNWHLRDDKQGTRSGSMIEDMKKEAERAAGQAWEDISTMGEKAWDKGVEGALSDPDFLDIISTARYYVDFYVSPSTSYSDSFSNRTEASAFANALNKGSDVVKEIAFFMGASAFDKSTLAENVATVGKSAMESMEALGKGKDGLFSRLIMDAQTIISGANIIFPEIWHASERAQSYRAEIKLVSPYGTREAIFLNTLVPMFHILAFTLPRQAGVNSYTAPFLVKAHILKWFSCEMGIIDSCEIQKGGWNVDGFPSEITISISFKDLYSALPISKIESITDAIRFAMNQSLLEYLSVLCGLNLKTSEFLTKFNMIKTLLKNVPGDYVDNATSSVRQEAVNAMSKLLGAFGGGRFG